MSEVEASAEAIAGWLAGVFGAERVTLSGFAKLSGGAIQENWAVDIAVEGGPEAGTIAAVLRTDAPAGVAASHSRAEEFRLLQIAHAAGMCVPRPIALNAERGLIGRPFFLCARAKGSAEGRRLVRKDDVAAFGPDLARRLGEELARLHTIEPPREELAFLGDPPADPIAARIAKYHGWLDAMDAAEPALEWALRWLERNTPKPRPTVLCHMDYRTGNYMVADGALTAILDWEFAAWGDPREDLAWFCARCWRFGATGRTAGGIADRADFLAGYNAHAARPVPVEELFYFEVLGTVRWAVIALQQGQRFHADGEPNLELPLTARIVPELTLDLLAYLAPEALPHAAPALPAADTALGETAATAELARRHLLDDILPLLPREKTYETLMIANAIAIAARELRAGPARLAAEAADHARLTGQEGSPASLRRALTEMIRAGGLDDAPDLVPTLARHVAASVAVANPKALGAAQGASAEQGGVRAPR